VSHQPKSKPKAVACAEWVLWTWTAWTCVFGIYHTWLSIPEYEQQLLEQSQGLISIAPDMIMKLAVAVYALVLVLSIWIIIEIGKGKHWARSSLLWGFAFQILFMFFPPYHGFSEYLADIPDVGLQAASLYLLYTKPGRDWFPKK